MVKRRTFQNKKSFQLTHLCFFHHNSLILLVKSKLSMHLLVKKITWLLLSTQWRHAPTNSLNIWNNRQMNSFHLNYQATETQWHVHLPYISSWPSTPLPRHNMQKSWLAAMEKIFPNVCSIFSLNSHFPRHILNSSYSWGGLNLTFFFNLQGIKN